MRIKYKAPGQFLYRRFWRVLTWDRASDGAIVAHNEAGKTLYLPAGMVVIIVGGHL